MLGWYLREEPTGSLWGKNMSGAFDDYKAEHLLRGICIHKSIPIFHHFPPFSPILGLNYAYTYSPE